MGRRHFLSRRGFLAAACAAAATAKEGPVAKGPKRLRAGAATTDITPERGVSLNGTILQLGPVRRVHDPLRARCLVLDDGASRVALLVADLTMVVGEVLNRAKELAREQTGIPPARMLMAATHTHAAPRVIGDIPGHYGLALNRNGPRDPDSRYVRFLTRQMALAVRRATRNLAPAEVAWGTVPVPEFPRNRRWFVKPGTMPPNPFGETDDQVLMYGDRKGIGLRPAGPADPALSVLAVRGADRRPLAVFADYGIHYVGGYGRGEVSADYFGYFAAAAREALDAGGREPPFVAALSNGASGDVGGLGGGYPRMRQVARRLADETRALWERMTWHGEASLAMKETELELGIRRPDAQRLEWARAAPKEPKGEGVHRWRDIYAREARLLARYPPKVAVRLQALRIGELGIAAIPCEVFAETGLAVKRRSPLEPTCVVGLANAYHGYLPTPAQHELGGYETWPARSSCLEVGAEPKIRAAVLGLLAEVSDDGEETP